MYSGNTRKRIRIAPDGARKRYYVTREPRKRIQIHCTVTV